MIIYYFDFIFLLFLIYKRSYFNIQLFNEFEFNKLLNLNLITDPDQNLASITVHTILIFSRKKHEKMNIMSVTQYQLYSTVLASH
jgi:hypothetical protein